MTGFVKDNRAEIRSSGRTTVPPSCTVVICTRDRPEALDRCLEAIAQLDYPREIDVLVVDNAPSNDRARDSATRWGARYVVESIPGLSRARNRGARECSSELVAYLDDDCVCRPEWLAAIALEFIDPKVMAVTGKVSLRNPDGTEAPVRQDGDERRVVDRETPGWFEMANFGGVGNGGNMVFRRRAFESWPGFDVRLGRGAPLWGGEDNHAFFSLIAEGYRVVYTPVAVVRHPYLGAGEDLRRREIKAYATQAAYVSLLLVERPRYWRETIRYVLGAIRAVERGWRHPKGRPPISPIVPTGRRWMAYVSGIWLYLRACLQRAPKRNTQPEAGAR